MLLLSVTSACGSQAAPAAVPNVVDSQPEPTSTTVATPTREATPAALLDVVGNQPEPTSIPAAAPTREATPAALRDVVGGVRIRAEGSLLFLTADALQRDVVQRIALLDGVSRVDSYLEVDTEPNPIVGVSPGSPLRLRGEPISLVSGVDFPPGEESVAILGNGVNANSYGFGMAGSMMAHRFQVGQTFELRGHRLRVIELYRAERDELEDSIMLPLSTAQRLYGMEGVVTSVVVSVDSPQRMEQVQRVVQKLLEEDQ